MEVIETSITETLRQQHSQQELTQPASADQPVIAVETQPARRSSDLERFVGDLNSKMAK